MVISKATAELIQGVLIALVQGLLCMFHAWMTRTTYVKGLV